MGSNLDNTRMRLEAVHSASPEASPARLAVLAEAETRAWVEHAVIGLHLCPFAGPVQARSAVRYVVSQARDVEQLLLDLCNEMAHLLAASPDAIETTLLIHPRVLLDFDDYNDFLDIADAALIDRELDGVLQVASFHPDYRFADVAPDDVTNATNRSPYPVLQLLREESIERAVAGVDDPDAIYRANLETLEALGTEGWHALREVCRNEALAELEASDARAGGHGATGTDEATPLAGGQPHSET